MDSWTSIFLCGEVQKPDRFPWINGICWAKTPTCFRTLFWSRFWHHSYAQCLFTNRGGWSWHHLTTWTRLQIGYVARAGELFGAGGFRNKRNLGRDIGLFFFGTIWISWNGGSKPTWNPSYFMHSSNNFPWEVSKTCHAFFFGSKSMEIHPCDSFTVTSFSFI